MSRAEYEVKVGWENNKDFLGLYDDITEDVKTIHFSRGKSDELGTAEVGQLSLTVNNNTGKYSPPNSSGVLYGNLLPKRPIKVIAKQPLITISVTKALEAAGDYAAETVMSESATIGTRWTFPNIVKVKGGYGYIVKAQAICETTSLTPCLTLYLFQVISGAQSNSGQYDDRSANISIRHQDLDVYVGKIDFPPMEDLGGDSETLVTSNTNGNLPLAFNCDIENTGIYGILVTRNAITGEIATMDMTIKLTIELPDYPQFYGFIEEIIPHPHLREQDAIITAVDGLDFLSRHDMATALYKNTKTGVIHSYILDDAGWNLDMRILDDGQDTIPYWYGADIKARFAQEEIDSNEQGFSYVDGAGNFRFEDRYHRSKDVHQTSQGTLDNTMGNITYSLNPKNVYNIVKVTVTPWTLQTEVELWQLQETPIIPVGETLTWWGDASVGGIDVFVNEWVTPVATTDYIASRIPSAEVFPYTFPFTFPISDAFPYLFPIIFPEGYDMTADIGLVATKFAKTIKLELTNNGTVPAYINLLKARGTYYDDQAQVIRKAEDSVSQTAYQKRTYELDGKYMTSADKAQSFANYAIGKYKDPRAELSLIIVNQDEATLAQILNREISDRITIKNTKLGITNQDFFIDFMEHDISLSGLWHTVTYKLADCINEDFWCLGYSKLGTQTKLGY